MMPTPDDLARIQGTDRYREMEAFSDAWLTRHADVLTDYARLWSPDPFHAWSRRWEYPWVMQQMRSWYRRQVDSRLLCEVSNRLRLLDAGSGVTFYPWYLRQAWHADVTCVDRDMHWLNTLLKIETRYIGEADRYVTAQHGDVSRLPFEDDTFDAAVCISVLEHTSNPLAGIAELQRVVRPGGLLVCTWDIIPARPWALQQDGLSVNGLALEV
ncbi:MAG: class I SAM-dependent methyltransferase [Armatimonadota bacterium]